MQAGEQCIACHQHQLLWSHNWLMHAAFGRHVQQTYCAVSFFVIYAYASSHWRVVLQ